MDLYLIRHTRPQIATGSCYGQLDVPLAPPYAAGCSAVAARLPSVQAVWSSPLARCRILADAIGARMNVTPLADERLRELWFGDWEGRRWETIDRDESERWAADYWNVAPRGGETYRTLYERVRLALADILACRAQCAAVVTHAGPIRAMLAHCLGLEPQRYHVVHLAYGGITLLRGGSEHWRLEYLNG